MTRRMIILIFIIGLIATFLITPKSKSNEVLGMPNFTVITRTHTPEPVPPTATKPKDNGGGNQPPQATATPVPPADTATPTLIPVTLAPTPIGGFLPTAVACGFPPTVQAQNTTRVRSGPGTDYEIITELVYLETRPIVGRAANAEWWIIQLTNDQFGWVANVVVTVHGNTSGVPIMSAPPLDGETPTPGPLWNPTPNPECPIIPSATPIPTETATDTPVPQPSATKTTPPTKTAVLETAEVENEVTEPTATATSVVPTSVVPTTETTQVDIEAESAQPTAEPLDGEDAQNAVSALPCAPALIGLAVIGFLAFRRIF